jgi:hypothetical protein
LTFGVRRACNSMRVILNRHEWPAVQCRP